VSNGSEAERWSLRQLAWYIGVLALLMSNQSEAIHSTVAFPNASESAIEEIPEGGLAKKQQVASVFMD
jgi:hypothetical protein